MVTLPVLCNNGEERQKGEEKDNTGGDACQVSLRERGEMDKKQQAHYSFTSVHVSRLW